MLLVILGVIILLWLLGFVGHVGGGLIHILLVIAVIVVIYYLVTNNRNRL